MQTKVFSPKYKVEIATNDGIMDVSKNVLKIETQSTTRGMCNKFRITFVPRTDANKEDIYSYIEPMAFVRIKFTHDKSANKMPTVMRGFINNVSKNMDIHGGKPVRTITATGENYGKLINMTYIHYLLGLDPMEVFASSGTQYPFLNAYNLDLINGKTTPSVWMTALYETFINKSFELVKKHMLNRRSVETATPIPTTKDEVAKKAASEMDDFVLDIDKDGVDGKRAPVGIPDSKAFNLVLTDPSAASADTSLSEFISNYCGSPWYELFTDDAPDKTYLVYRPFPFRDRDKKWVGSTAFAKPESYEAPAGRKDWNEIKKIGFDEVVAYSIQRTDEEVYNYFFTDANCSIAGGNYEIYSRSKLNNKNPHYTIDTTPVNSNSNTKLAQSEKLNFSRMELYGFRKFHRPTSWLSIKSDDTEKPETMKELGSDASMIQVGEQLTEILFNGMEHNSQLELGEIVIKGREDIRQGMFIEFMDERNEDKGHIFYVNEVFHSFIPFENFITRLMVSRGESHLTHISDDKNRY